MVKIWVGEARGASSARMRFTNRQQATDIAQGIGRRRDFAVFGKIGIYFTLSRLAQRNNVPAAGRTLFSRAATRRRPLDSVVRLAEQHLRNRYID
jgi:hypothetical protein